MYPEIHLSPGFGISTYFLIISLSTIWGAYWFIRRAEHLELARVTAIDLTITCLVGGFLGARLTHVLYEEPSYYLQNPWLTVQVWNGGFVFLGGVVAAIMAGFIFCQIRVEPFWFWADAAAPPIALTYALGRTACFFNGCCYGKACDLPWAVTFDHLIYRHPTQIYAAIWELALLGGLLCLEKSLRASGLLFNIWLVGHALGRLLMEHFRDDPRGERLFGLTLGEVMSLGLAQFAFVHLAIFFWINRSAKMRPRQ